MSEITMRVRDGISLSSVRLTDKPSLLEHFRTRDVYDTTLNIPYPYLDSHADIWIQKQIDRMTQQEKEVSFAIRDATDKLIGAIGADSLHPGTTHRAEIGYWLARPYWGQGIMTDAVRTFVEYAFSELALLRVTAHTFEFNIGSARVLEKNGFTLEGRLRKHFCKDGKLLDARLYGLLCDDARIVSE